VVEHDVLVSIDPKFGRQVSADWLVGIARLTLEMERVGQAQLSIVVTDDEQVRALNREYAGDDHATDVLSFSLEEGEAFASPPGNVRRLGEVIISHETAERQAREAGHDVEDETAHLLVHGILHLLGYDHLEAADEQRMRSRERGVLSELGFTAH
jgi:probable rRNA maturation factor